MKRLFFAIIIIQLLSTITYSATLDIGTRASYFRPPESGSTSTLMLGVDATYRIGGYFSAILAIENANYVVDEKQYSLTPITLSLIGQPYPNAKLSPYMGGGIGYYDKAIDGTSESTTGIHAMIGISLNVQTLNAGFEFRYTIPDTKDGSINYSSLSGHMTGGLHAEF